MDKEIIKDWLNDIATPTGISYAGDRTISESMVEKIVDYVDELEQQVKKQKEVIDKAIKYFEENYYDCLDFNSSKRYKKLYHPEKLLDILKEVSE